jgi:hypothetical protein
LEALLLEQNEPSDNEVQAVSGEPANLMN